MKPNTYRKVRTRFSHLIVGTTIDAGYSPFKLFVLYPIYAAAFLFFMCSMWFIFLKPIYKEFDLSILISYSLIILLLIGVYKIIKFIFGFLEREFLKIVDKFFKF